jgi:hypothetical protein
VLLKPFDAQNAILCFDSSPNPKDNPFSCVAQKTNELSFRSCIYLLEPMEEVNERFVLVVKQPP